jgi:hypothetical protein
MSAKQTRRNEPFPEGARQCRYAGCDSRLSTPNSRDSHECRCPLRPGFVKETKASIKKPQPTTAVVPTAAPPAVEEEEEEREQGTTGEAATTPDVASTPAAVRAIFANAGLRFVHQVAEALREASQRAEPAASGDAGRSAAADESDAAAALSALPSAGD